jgi:hypothetical protein
LKGRIELRQRKESTVSSDRRGIRSVFVLVALACALVTGYAEAASRGDASTAAPPACRGTQLGLSGHLAGATQSLLGTLTLTNRSGRDCALPQAPLRVSIVIGRRVLPTLTTQMGNNQPPGTPTRVLPKRGRVVVGTQWQNWCGAPRGNVRASLSLTVNRLVTLRLGLGVVRTPPCVHHRFTSTVAVSRFIKPSQ